MFAAYHTQVMVEMSDDEDFEELLDVLGIIKNARPFAGHTFEACVHLMVERGATDSVDYGFLTPNLGLPKSLNIWLASSRKGGFSIAFTAPTSWMRPQRRQKTAVGRQQDITFRASTDLLSAKAKRDCAYTLFR